MVARTDTIDGAPDIGVWGRTRAVMNFRRRPSIRATRIGKIPWGGEMVIIGRTRQGGLDFWYHVRYGDKIGWIKTGWTTVYGPVHALPIR
jgi:hypothetical protein